MSVQRLPLLVVALVLALCAASTLGLSSGARKLTEVFPSFRLGLLLFLWMDLTGCALLPETPQSLRLRVVSGPPVSQQVKSQPVPAVSSATNKVVEKLVTLALEVFMTAALVKMLRAVRMVLSAFLE